MIPLRPSLNDPCQPPRNKLHATGPRRTSPTTLTPIPSSRIRRSAPKYQNKSRKHPKPRTGLFRYWGLSGQDGFLTDSDESPPEWVAAPVVPLFTRFPWSEEKGAGTLLVRPSNPPRRDSRRPPQRSFPPGRVGGIVSTGSPLAWLEESGNRRQAKFASLFLARTARIVVLFW